MSKYEIASLIISVISLLILLGGVFYAGRQLHILRATLCGDHDLKRRIAAQDALKELTNRVEYRQILERHFHYIDSDEPISLDVIQKTLEKEPDLKIILADLLNYYEMLARGVWQGIYDELVIEDAQRIQMQKIYSTFSIYIKEQRKNNAEIWCRMESLVNEWAHQKTKSSQRNKTGL